MDWPIIVAIVVAVPLIAFPVAFVWYLNISGLYRVIADSRQREKKRAAARKRAHEIA